MVPTGKNSMLVTFDQSCDTARETEDADALLELLKPGKEVTVNLASTKQMSPEWVRWLARMQVEAKTNKAKLTLLSMQPSVQRTINALGLTNHFTLAVKTPEPEYCLCGNPSSKSSVSSPIDTVETCFDCGRPIFDPTLPRVAKPFDPYDL